MVQMAKLAQIRRDWVTRGKPPCKHLHTDREYDLGANTGDIGCLECGETWWEGGKPPATSGDGATDLPTP
jgi:hypothetical protein